MTANTRWDFVEIIVRTGRRDNYSGQVASYALAMSFELQKKNTRVCKLTLFHKVPIARRIPPSVGKQGCRLRSQHMAHAQQLWTDEEKKHTSNWLVPRIRDGHADVPRIQTSTNVKVLRSLVENGHADLQRGHVHNIQTQDIKFIRRFTGSEVYNCDYKSLLDR